MNVYTYVRWDVVFNPCNCFWLFRDNHLFILTKFQLISRYSQSLITVYGFCVPPAFSSVFFHKL